MDIKVGGVWEGLDTIADDGIAQTRPEVERLVRAGAVLLVERIKRRLTGPRSGRRYRHPDTGAPHIAAKEGESPAKMRGTLLNSIGHGAVQWEGDEATSEVGPGVGSGANRFRAPKAVPAERYAMIQEYGGTIVGRGGAIIVIPPHPYLAPAVEEATPEIWALWERDL